MGEKWKQRMEKIMKEISAGIKKNKEGNYGKKKYRKKLQLGKRKNEEGNS